MHAASGLRCMSHSGVFLNADSSIASAQVANSSTWKVLPLDTVYGTYSQTAIPQTYSSNRVRLAFPCTPCVTYRQTNGTPANNQIFSIRVTGFDQFGSSIQEVVMSQTTAQAVRVIGVPVAPYVRLTRLWLSKVFAEITRIEYQASSVQGTSDHIDVGTHWDFDYGGNQAPYENYIGQNNQGIGTLLRMQPYGPSQPVIAPEMLALELVNLDPQVHLLGAGFNLDPGTYTLDALNAVGDVHPVTNFSVANPTVVTVTGAFGYASRMKFPIRIAGDTQKLWLNGEWLATSTADGSATFSLPVNVASVHSSYTGIVAYVPTANIRTTRNIPVLLGGLQSPNPATLNGFHWSTWLSGYVFTIPLAATASGTGGFVQVLNQPTADLQAYNTAATGSSARGGFRLGTNVAGFAGTPHKWNIFKAVGTNPILASEHRFDIPTSTAIATELPWPRNARVGFKAYYRSQAGIGRANSSSSYAT